MMSGYFLSRWMNTLALLLLAVSTFMHANSTKAADRTAECNSVVNKATITLSGKLLLGVSESSTDKTCHFIVSLPPPHSVDISAVNAWFKFRAEDALNKDSATKLLTGLAFAVTPKESMRHIKDIEIQIVKNSALTSECFAALFKRTAIEARAPDGQFTCSVPPSADFAVFSMSAGPGLKNTFVLPRQS